MTQLLGKIIDYFTPEVFKKKGLEESIDDFQQRIDLVVSDLIYPYLHPSEESQTGISTSENERFIQLLSLLEPDQCQKISLILAENLNKKYNKVELEQFTKSIYVEHPSKLLGKISKETMCQSVAIHYTKILNLIAAILSAVNPNYNICLNRLDNLMTLTTSDATIGLSHVCQKTGTVARSILDEPGMRELLVLYYFALVQDITTPEEKDNITKQYNYLVNSFSNLVYQPSGAEDNLEGLMEVPKKDNEMMDTANQLRNKLKDMRLENKTNGGNKRVNCRINKLEGELTSIQNQIKQQGATSNNVSRSVLNKLNGLVSKMETLQENLEEIKMSREIEKPEDLNEMKEELETAPPTEFPISPEQKELEQEIGFQPTVEKEGGDENMSSMTNVEELEDMGEIPDEDIIGQEEGEMLSDADMEGLENLSSLEAEPIPSNQTMEPAAPMMPPTAPIVQSTDTMMPSAAPMMPPTAQMMPSTDTMMPSAAPMMPPTAPMMPSTDTIMPSAAPSVSSTDTMMPSAAPMMASSAPSVPSPMMAPAAPSVPSPMMAPADPSVPSPMMSPAAPSVPSTSLSPIPVNQVGGDKNNKNNEVNMSDEELNKLLANMNIKNNIKNNPNQAIQSSNNLKPAENSDAERMVQNSLNLQDKNKMPEQNNSMDMVQAVNVEPSMEKLENVNKKETDVVSKFLEFANMFQKIEKMDPKIIPFIETAFKKQNNFDPANGFQRDMFIPKDNFQMFCEANMNENGEIMINLNDDKFKGFLMEYENLKKLYIQKSGDLLALLENKILERKENPASSNYGSDSMSKETTIGNFSVAKINYSELSVLETDIRNILVDLYTKAHTYYQMAVGNLFRALTEIKTTPPSL
jgi:hypothetical protein